MVFIVDHQSWSPDGQLLQGFYLFYLSDDLIGGLLGVTNRCSCYGGNLLSFAVFDPMVLVPHLPYVHNQEFFFLNTKHACATISSANTVKWPMEYYQFHCTHLSTNVTVIIHQQCIASLCFSKSQEGNFQSTSYTL